MARRSRWLPAALAAIALAVVGAGCGDDDDEQSGDRQAPQAEQFPASTTMGKIQRKGEIRIGVKYDVPPFGFKNPQNSRIEGFDVDFGKAVADALGVKPTYVEAISDNRIPFITDGKVDLVLSTMTINEERAAEIGFSQPYFIAHGRVLKKTGESNIHNLRDLSGKTVCTALGSTYEETLKKRFPKAKRKLVDTYSECLELIQNGAVEAVSTDDVILTGMIIQDKGLELVDAPALTVEPYGAGFKKGDAQFAEFVDGVLADYKRDGRWQRSYDRWMGRFTGEKQTPPTATLEDALAGKVE